MKQHYNLFFLRQNNQMDTLYLNLLFLLSCLVLKEVKMSGLHSSKRASVNERGGGGGGWTGWQHSTGLDPASGHAPMAGRPSTLRALASLLDRVMTVPGTCKCSKHWGRLLGWAERGPASSERPCLLQAPLGRGSCPHFSPASCVLAHMRMRSHMAHCTPVCTLGHTVPQKAPRSSRASRASGATAWV